MTGPELMAPRTWSVDSWAPTLRWWTGPCSSRSRLAGSGRCCYMNYCYRSKWPSPELTWWTEAKWFLRKCCDPTSNLIAMRFCLSPSYVWISISWYSREWVCQSWLIFFDPRSQEACSRSFQRWSHSSCSLPASSSSACTLFALPRSGFWACKFRLDNPTSRPPKLIAAFAYSLFSEVAESCARGFGFTAPLSRSLPGVVSPVGLAPLLLGGNS